MLGQDTEFFLWDTKANKAVPAHTYFPPAAEKANVTYAKAPANGEKRPFNKRNDIAAFRDGFAVEFNSPPCTCRAFLFEDLRLGIKNARALFNIPEHIVFSTVPLVKIDTEELVTWPPDLRELGCHPTLDAYTGEIKRIRVDPLTLPFRTSGSHIHLSGISKILDNRKNWAPFIKLADLFVGLPQTVLYGDDLEYERRTLYGQAGEFRHQEYGGLEYRVCSSRILDHVAVYSLLTGIYRDICAKRFFQLVDHWNPAIEEPLQKAINTGVGAVELLEDMFKMMYKVSPNGLYPFVGLCKRDKEGKFVYASTDAYQTLREPITMDLFLKAKDIIRKVDKPAVTCLTYPTDGCTSPWHASEAHIGWPEYIETWFKPAKAPEGPMIDGPEMFEEEEEGDFDGER